jgi:hypothetical protein
VINSVFEKHFVILDETKGFLRSSEYPGIKVLKKKHLWDRGKTKRDEEKIERGIG